MILFRNKYSPNGIIIYYNYAEIIMYDKEQNITGKTIIDIEDIDIVKNYKWFIDVDGYAVAHYNKSIIRIHRLLINAPKGIQVDHKDRNKLNNRKYNLRFATHSQNGMNKGIQNNNTSGVTGVNWNSWCNKWEARIKKDKQYIRLGYFDNKEDAIKARLEAEPKYFGEYTPINKYKGE